MNKRAKSTFMLIWVHQDISD